jgi:hypothetical protein
MAVLVPRLRVALDPLIAEAKERARRRRIRTAGVLALLVVGGLMAAMPRPQSPVASAASAGTVSDGVLRATLPPGWSASVGPGFYQAPGGSLHPEAWVLLGDFRFPSGAARHEAGVSVPNGRVLVQIGDFFPEGPSTRWQTVSSLAMPRALLLASRRWSVRYAGRALSIKVIFGSRPADVLVHQVERLLAGVHRAAH